MDLMTRVVSPYDLNPFGLNSIRSILGESIDSRASREAPIKLFITATNVHTAAGASSVTRNHAERAPRVRLPADHVPGDRDRRRTLWDGRYAGNPTITPLVRESDAHDTILVQINPRERRELPRTAARSSKPLDRFPSTRR